jgi:hypothetical protein
VPNLALSNVILVCSSSAKRLDWSGRDDVQAFACISSRKRWIALRDTMQRRLVP